MKIVKSETKELKKHLNQFKYFVECEYGEFFFTQKSTNLQ